MNKKIVLSLVCIVLPLALNAVEDLQAPFVEPAVLHNFVRNEMQEMREKLIRYGVELQEHTSVSDTLYKKVRFWFAHPVGAFWGIVASAGCAAGGICVEKPVPGVLAGAAAGVLIFVGVSEFVAHILSACKFGWIFNEWNRKEKLEEYLIEDRVAIKSLGAHLSKEELNVLEREEKNKELKRLLFDLIRVKR